jgi:hypothetical protein
MDGASIEGKGEFHLAQRAPATMLCGLAVDFNDPNPDRPDFGAFTIDDDIQGNGRHCLQAL